VLGSTFTKKKKKKKKKKLHASQKKIGSCLKERSTSSCVMNECVEWLEFA
jgi:hypothetical protein